MIIINLKAYREGIGKRALELGLQVERLAREYSVEVALAAQPTDIFLLSSKLDIPILAQHIDAISPGAHTGHIVAEAVREAGAVGTLLNHSEKRLRIDEIHYCIRAARNVGLDVIVCADTPETAIAVAALNPDAIAIEPPELIGTGVSVSKAKPEVITETLKLIGKFNPKIPVLTGAGISSGEDVLKALQLKTLGVLVASAAVKGEDRLNRIRGMVEAVYRYKSQHSL